MAAGTENLLPSAKDMMQKMALAEAEEASKIAREQAAAEAEKNALLDRLKGPSGVSDEEAIKRVMPVIQRAVSKGKTEVLVYRFPNALCTDGGRAINQAEPGWENTLTGIPKEVFKLWERQFKDRGYKLKVEIVDFPGGIPGDVGMTLKWG